MIVKIEVLPGCLDPNVRAKVRHNIAFNAEAVVLVREILALDRADQKRTRIVFKGDTYEHHAVETDVSYEDILKMIGW